MFNVLLFAAALTGGEINFSPLQKNFIIRLQGCWKLNARLW